jgi:hypothetical protein
MTQGPRTLQDPEIHSRNPRSCIFESRSRSRSLIFSTWPVSQRALVKFNTQFTAKCVHNLSEKIFVYGQRRLYCLSEPIIQTCLQFVGLCSKPRPSAYETLANLHDSGYFPFFSNILFFKSFSWPPKTVRDRNQLDLCLVCTDKYFRNLVLGGDSE